MYHEESSEENDSEGESSAPTMPKPATPKPRDIRSIPPRRGTLPPGKPRLIDVDDLRLLLADVGIVPRSVAESQIMEEVVEKFIEDERSGEIDFKCYLMFLKVIRQKMSQCNLGQL